MTLIQISDNRKRNLQRRYPMRISSLNTENSQLKSKIKVYNATVKLFASRCRIRKTKCTTAKISKYHILEYGNTSQDICRKILNTDVGLNKNDKNIDVNRVIPMLSPILEKFKNRHNRFNYFDKLKHVITKNNSQQEYQISKGSLKSFFNLLLYEIVRLELFGTLQNFKAVKKTIHNLLKTVPKKILITRAYKRKVQTAKAVGALLNIQPLFNKFDIYNIKWLHSIDSDTEKWIIILKLLHWFFAQYIIKILHKYIVVKSVKGQWVYIAKDDWCKKQEKFINERKSICNLVPYISTKYEPILYLPIRRYKFIPTASGLRALSIGSYNVKEKFDDVDVVLRFLQQLYVTYFNENGIPTMSSCKTKIKNFGESTKNKLFFVRCDIQDAFGSIKQDKLYDIIKRACEVIPIYLVLRTYTLKKKKNYNRNGVQTVQFEVLKKCKHAEALVNKEKPKLVKKTKLLPKIKKLIFEQKIKIDDQIYSVKSGVPQGTRVSPIFSDIYYQHMIMEKFSEYEENGCLCMYVDDILYITESEDYATRFLETIQNGIPEYNVKFNPNKIQKNVGLSDKTREMKITFLGWTIKFVEH